MLRRARLVLPNVPLHIIQRGNNRQPCFFADEDYSVYLDWMAEYVGKTGCRVHAYVLMINHVRGARKIGATTQNAGTGIR
jgi:putative transposase